MLPLRDHVPSERRPIVTYLIILANAFVFWLELTASDPETFIFSYALVPQLVDFNNWNTLLPFLTSMFLHGGWLHIISNMWFLKVFGDNVEGRMGHIKFLFIYLLAGFVGGLLQYMLEPGSPIPMLGASGAVAGVLGGYLYLFPNHKVDTLVPIFFYVTIARLPAFVMIWLWFLLQVFSGFGSLGEAGVEGGVAFFAHIGGFIGGMFLVALLGSRRRVYRSS